MRAICLPPSVSKHFFFIYLLLFCGSRILHLSIIFYFFLWFSTWATLWSLKKMDLAYKLPCLLVLAKPVTKKTEWLFQGYQRGRLFSRRRFPFNSCLEWKWSSILPSILHPVGDHFWLLAKPSGYILIFHYICFLYYYDRRQHFNVWQVSVPTGVPCCCGPCQSDFASVAKPPESRSCQIRSDQ